MYPLQSTTLKKAVTYQGIGLHRGLHNEISLLPAAEGSGLTLEIDGEITSLHYSMLQGNNRGTYLQTAKHSIATVEHLTGCLLGLGVDNCHIRMAGDEIPINDGSALELTRLIQKVGLKYYSSKKNLQPLKKVITLRSGNKSLVALPAETFKVTFLFEHSSFYPQLFSFDLLHEDFATEIAPARTFGFQEEIAELQQNGLIKGASISEAVLIQGRKTSLPLRFPDEFVRHKLLDFLGDIALSGKIFLGHFIVLRSGHIFNNLILRKLMANYAD